MFFFVNEEKVAGKKTQNLITITVYRWGCLKSAVIDQ